MTNRYPPSKTDKKAWDLDNPAWREEFENELIESSNVLRAKHHSPALVGNPEIAKVAQEWANYLAKINKTVHRPNNRYGENIFYKWHRKHLIHGSEVPQSFYNEIKYYYPYFQKEPNLEHFHRFGHFSQLLWRESEEMGTGIAVSGDKIFIVINYHPRGNWPDEYATNVLPAYILSSVRLDLINSNPHPDHHDYVPPALKNNPKSRTSKPRELPPIVPTIATPILAANETAVEQEAECATINGDENIPAESADGSDTASVQTAVNNKPPEPVAVVAPALRSSVVSSKSRRSTRTTKTINDEKSPKVPKSNRKAPPTRHNAANIITFRPDPKSSSLSSKSSRARVEALLLQRARLSIAGPLKSTVPQFQLNSQKPLTANEKQQNSRWARIGTQTQSQGQSRSSKSTTSSRSGPQDKTIAAGLGSLQTQRHRTSVSGAGGAVNLNSEKTIVARNGPLQTIRLRTTEQNASTNASSSVKSSRSGSGKNRVRKTAPDMRQQNRATVRQNPAPVLQNKSQQSTTTKRSVRSSARTTKSGGVVTTKSGGTVKNPSNRPANPRPYKPVMSQQYNNNTTTGQQSGRSSQNRSTISSQQYSSAANQRTPQNKGSSSSSYSSSSRASTSRRSDNKRSVQVQVAKVSTPVQVQEVTATEEIPSEVAPETIQEPAQEVPIPEIVTPDMQPENASSEVPIEEPAPEVQCFPVEVETDGLKTGDQAAAK